LFLSGQTCPPYREAFQVNFENLARDKDLIFGNKLDQISVQKVARGENHAKRQVVQIFEVDTVCGAGRNKSERKPEMEDQCNAQAAACIRQLSVEFESAVPFDFRQRLLEFVRPVFRNRLKTKILIF